mgnify:CR=1 FL=1
MKFDVAIKDDLTEILSLQKECYVEESEIYNDHHIPPLVQTIESIYADFDTERFFKLVENS